MPPCLFCRPAQVRVSWRRTILRWIMRSSWKLRPVLADWSHNSPPRLFTRSRNNNCFQKDRDVTAVVLGGFIGWVDGYLLRLEHEGRKNQALLWMISSPPFLLATCVSLWSVLLFTDCCVFFLKRAMGVWIDFWSRRILGWIVYLSFYGLCAEIQIHNRIFTVMSWSRATGFGFNCGSLVGK